MKCQKCERPIVRIQRYKVSVEWDYRPETNTWDLSAFDDGTHFHLFCSSPYPDEHETKVWGRNLPNELQRVVYPGEA